MTGLSAGSGSPLGHVVDHPIAQVEADLGMLTPNGVLTLLSNHVVMIILAGLLLSLGIPLLVRKRRGKEGIDEMVATGPANAIEAVCAVWRDQIARPALQEHTDRFIKYIWSVFFLVLTMNILGLLPLGVLNPWHIGGTATGNIWVTATLAICTLLMMVINGIRLGGKEYIAHFCPGPLWLAPLLVPVELVGLLAKTFALSVRLFANMVAGHVLLGVLVGFIIGAWASMGALGGLAVALPVVLGSVFITLLEIFVACLQAFIFAFLTTLFLGMSVVFHHEEHHEKHHEEAEAHA